MTIKASTITNLTDARYFAAREVAYLGFNLEEGTEGYLDPTVMKAIREWVEGPQIVGEFSRASVGYVREATAFFGLDAVELEAGFYEKQLVDFQGLEVLLRVPVGADFSENIFEKRLREAAPHVRFFVLDFVAGGVEWSDFLKKIAFWKKISEQFQTLLHLDFSPEKMTVLLENLPGAGIALRGGGEEKVGVKSFDEVEMIFEKIEENLMAG